MTNAWKMAIQPDMNLPPHKFGERNVNRWTGLTKSEKNESQFANKIDGQDGQQLKKAEDNARDNASKTRAKKVLSESERILLEKSGQLSSESVEAANAEYPG